MAQPAALERAQASMEAARRSSEASSSPGGRSIAKLGGSPGGALGELVPLLRRVMQDSTEAGPLLGATLRRYNSADL